MQRTLFIALPAAVVAAMASWLLLSGVTGTSTTAKAASGTAKVLLFTDGRTTSPDEARMVQLARSAAAMPGVSMLQYDAVTHRNATVRYAVKVSPTVLVLAADGTEHVRFEGATPTVIAHLQSMLGSLSHALP